MLTNETRRSLLNRAKAVQFPGSIMEVYKAAEQGIDVLAEHEAQMQQQPQVAQTPEQQEVGLREEHAQGNTQASMAFPDVQPNQSFNTVGMKAPIDIQKIDDQGHLVESYKNVPPGIQDLPTGPNRGTVIESPAAYQKGGFEKQFNTNYQESQNYQRIKGSRKGVRQNPDDSHSTHLMSDNNKDEAWPTLFQNKDGSWVEGGYKEAKERGEIYKFDSKKELIDFARKGNWKNAYQKGGVKEDKKDKGKKVVDTQDLLWDYEELYQGNVSEKELREHLLKLNVTENDTMLHVDKTMDNWGSRYIPIMKARLDMVEKNAPFKQSERRWNSPKYREYMNHVDTEMENYSENDRETLNIFGEGFDSKNADGSTRDGFSTSKDGTYDFFKIPKTYNRGGYKQKYQTGGSVQKYPTPDNELIPDPNRSVSVQVKEKQAQDKLNKTLNKQKFENLEELYNIDPVNFADGIAMTGIPVISEGADLASAAVSTSRGNYTDAAASLAGLGIPFLGGAAFKSMFKKFSKSLKRKEGQYMYRGLGPEGYKDAIKSNVLRGRQTPNVNMAGKFNVGKTFPNKTYYSPEEEIAKKYGKGYYARVPVEEFEGKLINDYGSNNTWSQYTKSQIPTNKAEIFKPLSEKVEGPSIKSPKNHSLYRVVDASGNVEAAKFGSSIPASGTVGRRSGIQGTIQKNTDFDHISATTDQSWLTGKNNLFDRYGGNNPYVVKLQGHEGKIHQVAEESTDDILAKIRPGSYTNMKVAGPQNQEIVSILGPKGSKVSDVKGVMSKAEYDAAIKKDPNFKFKRGGYRPKYL